MEAKVNAVAYETIRETDGWLPLLTPMSEVAGSMAVQVGAEYLEAPTRRTRHLLGGVPGVARANVVIVGGGVVGHIRRRWRSGWARRSRSLIATWSGSRARTTSIAASGDAGVQHLFTVRDAVRQAELVVGAVLIPGASAPKLVRRDMIETMKPGR